MKNFILKALYIIAFATYIISTMSYAQNSTMAAVVVDVIAVTYMAIFTIINKGKWIFK